jgi:hypothetical protein
MRQDFLSSVVIEVMDLVRLAGEDMTLDQGRDQSYANLPIIMDFIMIKITPLSENASIYNPDGRRLVNALTSYEFDTGSGYGRGDGSGMGRNINHLCYYGADQWDRCDGYSDDGRDYIMWSGHNSLHGHGEGNYSSGFYYGLRHIDYKDGTPNNGPGLEDGNGHGYPRYPYMYNGEIDGGYSSF